MDQLKKANQYRSDLEDSEMINKPKHKNVEKKRQFKLDLDVNGEYNEHVEPEEIVKKDFIGMSYANPK